ncbi:MAG TPA: type II toxin-antitoxin system RelE/ParE family toxin [Aestuariivirgaceae bacterium]|jgi:toxin HigB-1|nr:type II toxin-antitoxin system RelE/ParE family toxin [Aestuariivirgaceae bacterium]
MIESFRHKGLRRFYEQGDRSKLPSQMTERIAIILAALDVAKSIDDLNRPSFRLHPLKGELRGFWSITVTANWRIVFRFEDRNVLDVDFMDYH